METELKTEISMPPHRNTVSKVLKYFFLVLCSLSVGFLLGIQYAPVEETPDKGYSKISPSEDDARAKLLDDANDFLVKSDSEKVPQEIIQKTTHNVSSSTDDPMSEYLNQKIKVVGIVENPFSTTTMYNTLQVVSARIDPNYNSDSCGNAYGGKCYFFIEANHYGYPHITFVGTWESAFSMDMQSIKFIAPNLIEFKASFGDAGVSGTSVWNMDITTGSSTLISKEMNISI